MQIPDRPDMLPVLPVLYVAWSDGILTDQEIARIRDRAKGCGALRPGSEDVLERWLDPSAPPSPTELRALREHIRALVEVAPSLKEPALRSLSDLGLALENAGAPVPRAVAGGPGWEDPEAIASLREVEELLGVQGAEAVRALLGPAGATVTGASLPAPFDPATSPGAIGAYMRPDHQELRDELLSLIQNDRFTIPFEVPKSAYRERVLGLLRELADRGYGTLGYPESVGGGGDVAAGVVAFETLAFGDLSLLVKFGVQFGLFGGSILNLGTEKHHRAYLADVGSLTLPGCYGMSETGHGSNVHDVETTARHDPATGEFVIHTPHTLATKDWLGNAAEHGRMATVFAQLHVAGENHGVHAFLVPIRGNDGAPLPGVAIEDCGHKVGLNGVDNGRIRFDEVRVSGDALLDRFAGVDSDGTYTSPIPSEARRFFTMLGTLVAGRVSIAAASVSTAKKGLATAVRYSDRRRQFGPAQGDEVPILDYLSHQRLLLPRLATTYALDFAVQDLIGRYAARSEDTQRELEVRAAALKAVASWHNVETLQACREACGGKGYLSENLFGRLKADTDVFATFEGANIVLLQLAAKGLLSQYRHEMGDLKLWGITRYIAESAGRRVAELNPLITRKHDDDHLLDSDFHSAAVQYREDHLLGTLARRLKSRMDDGMDSFEAMNQCQDHVVTLALAYADRLLMEEFQRGVDGAPDNVREALTPVYRLFALCTLEKSRAWYLESGYMEPVKTKAIRAMVNRCLGDVRTSATCLVDAFMIPEALLGPAAFIDERPDPV